MDYFKATRFYRIRGSWMEGGRQALGLQCQWCISGVDRVTY